MEEESSTAESLDEDTRTKLVATPTPKVSNTRKGIVSNHMAHMMLLEKIVPHRLKEIPETKDYCCARACRHCDALLRMPWKVSASKKSKIGSFHASHAQNHLDKAYTEEGRN